MVALTFAIVCSMDIAGGDGCGVGGVTRRHPHMHQAHNARTRVRVVERIRREVQPHSYREGKRAWPLLVE
jgi:hypothetical protein